MQHQSSRSMTCTISKRRRRRPLPNRPASSTVPTAVDSRPVLQAAREGRRQFDQGTGQNIGHDAKRGPKFRGGGSRGVCRRVGGAHRVDSGPVDAGAIGVPQFGVHHVDACRDAVRIAFWRVASSAWGVQVHRNHMGRTQLQRRNAEDAGAAAVNRSPCGRTRAVNPVSADTAPWWDACRCRRPGRGRAAPRPRRGRREDRPRWGTPIAAGRSAGISNP